MPAPTVLPGRAFQQIDPRSNLLFHWRASDMALTNVSRDSTGVFSRASAGGEVKNTNDQLTGPPADGAPMWEWSTRESAMAMRLEGARQNLTLRSEQIDNGSWTKVRSSIDANSTLVAAPDGRFAADVAIPSTDDNSHYFTQTVTGTSGADYAVSGFFRAKELDRFRFMLLSGPGSTELAAVTANLTTEALTNSTANGGTVDRATLTGYGDDWYRLAFTADMNSTHSAIVQRVELHSSTGGSVFAGNGTDGLYAWGLQFEDSAAFESSYIPTVGSAVTRAANTFKFPIAWEPDYGYTLYGKIVCRMLANTGEAGYLLEIGNSGDSSLRLLTRFSGDAWRLQTTTDAGGAVTTQIAGAVVPTIGDTFEFRVSVPASGDITWGVSKNGGAEATTTHTPGAWDAAFDALFFHIGQRGNAAEQGYASHIAWKVAPGSGRSLGYLRQAF